MHWFLSKACFYVLITISIPCIQIHASKHPDLEYHDAAGLTVINRPQDDAPGWQRVDVEKFPDFSKGVNKYYAFPTGLAVAFATDSPYLYAKWKTGGKNNFVNTPLIAQQGLTLYIRNGNDGWTFAGVGKPTFGGVQHEDVLAEHMDASVKECLLYLPLLDSLESIDIGVRPGSKLSPLANPFGGKKLVAIGSSITHGVSVSSPGMAYPARMERDLGIEVVNLGASGQCKLNPCFARIAAGMEADAFLFDAFSNPTAGQIESRLMNFVDTIRAAHPDTPLIFLQTLRRESTNFNAKISAIEKGKREAAERGMDKVMKKYDNIYFINPGMPVGDDHNGTCDGVHPTDLGHDRILSMLEPVIAEILGLQDPKSE